MSPFQRAIVGVLIAALLLLAVLARYESNPMPSNVGLWITDRWTGSVALCSAGNCRLLDGPRLLPPRFDGEPANR